MEESKQNETQHTVDDWRMVNSNLSFIPKGEIHSVKSDGTNRTEFAPAAILGSPVGLALDWITQNLYYTNPSTQSIEVKQMKMGCVIFFLVFI